MWRQLSTILLLFVSTTAAVNVTSSEQNRTIAAKATRPQKQDSWFDNAAIEDNNLSPCYAAINYHILDRNRGRLEVTEQQTVQFSLSLNTTSDAYLSLTDSDEGCSSVWVRIVVEPVTASFKTTALVNSETDMFSDDIVDSIIVELRHSERFPVRLYARGLFLGYSIVHFQALPKTFKKNDKIDSQSQWVTFRSGKIATFRYHRVIDTIFQGIIFTLIICGNIGIGLKVNWTEIRQVLKKPIGPAIGFCCQYLVMPLAGFAVVNLIDLPPNMALGVFLMGCAPGGGGSNYHTYFLGGNVPLSVTMTFVSTAAAVGMMPLWVFTLGRLVANEAKGGIQPDYRGILGALFNSITPFLIGILINWKYPKTAKRIFLNVVRPLLIFVFVYMMTVGTFTNLYLFKLMTPKLLLAGLLLPYIGFSLGFIIALLLRQPRSIAITIAIETGIQAAGVAFATLYLSLPQPDADIAAVGPLAVILFTPVPLWIAELIRGIYLCIKKRRCFIFDSCRKSEDGENDSGDKPAEVMVLNLESNNNRNEKRSLLSVTSDDSSSPVFRPPLSPIFESPTTPFAESHFAERPSNTTVENENKQNEELASNYDNMEEQPESAAVVFDDGKDNKEATPLEVRPSDDGSDSDIQQQTALRSPVSMYFDAETDVAK